MRALLLAGAATLALAGATAMASAQSVYGAIPAASAHRRIAEFARATSRDSAYAPQRHLISEHQGAAGAPRTFRILGASGAVP